MSKKRLYIISLIIVCISQILLFSSTFNGIGKNVESPPQSNPPEIPEGPEFVIPESPLGTLALISALAAAFGVFALAKRGRRTPSLRL